MGPERQRQEHARRSLAGRDGYDVTGGEVIYYGKDLLDLDPEERAREGLFLAFQYPVEIPGVNSTYFLKAALQRNPQAQGPAGTRRDGIPHAREGENETARTDRTIS